MTNKIIKTNKEWKEKLSPEEYLIMREKGTEARHTGKYIHEDSDGVYCCAACDQELFSSKNKFKSSCGWPSFDEALEGSVIFKEDNSHGMRRVEVLCSSCESHLGHIFDDGPTDNGKRFCMNSIALNLEKND